MKTTPLAAVAVANLAIWAFATPQAAAQSTRIPALPIGTLSAFPTVVQTGTKPTLTWSIMYPSKVSDVAVINPPGTIIPNQPIYIAVYPVGTGIQACSTPATAADPLWPAEARISINSAAFKQIFYGTQADVNPSKALYIKKISANSTVDFGGRYVNNGAWSPFYTTRSSNLQVVALVKGDTPPTTFPLYQQSFLANYLRPYLDASGKVNIGPLSVLIVMELNQTDHGQSCFSYQDMVLLVNLSTNHPNHGHGNNLDGVDSSNPGQGQGGPNGAVDPSGGVDDEIR